MLTHTVVSYPDRGPWGESSYRGNCSGYLIKDLIETFGPSSILDPMEGSGTTREVASQFGIPYLGYDIQTGHDILHPMTKTKMWTDALALPTIGADMIFFHPPYWNMIQYSAAQADFSHGPYSMYLARMQTALTILQRCLSKTGFIALLLGDLRRRRTDHTYFLTDDVTESAKIAAARLRKEIRIIKIQHNTVTAGVTDLSIKFAHEYLTILRNGKAPADAAPEAVSPEYEDEDA